MSDTPETNEAQFQHDTFCDNARRRYILVVPAKLSRKLERERDDAMSRVGRYRGLTTDLAIQRNEAWEALREIAAADWKTSGELRGMARKVLEAAK